MRPLLHYYNIADDVVAFSSTRHGGVSEGNYGEFNINPYCGDNDDFVDENLAYLSLELGIQPDKILLPHQVHGTKQLDVTDGFMRLPIEARYPALEGYDCISTQLRGVCIGVSTADCIPVLLYDKAHHVVEAIHAGWRGTVQRIVEDAFPALRIFYHTVPKDVVAVIGPGISLKNFEVGQEVYDAFAQAGFNMDVLAKKYPVKDDPQGRMKWHIDLPLCNKMQLLKAGVREENIIMSGICTYDNVDDYFSARRLGQSSGRIFNGIMLK